MKFIVLAFAALSLSLSAQASQGRPGGFRDGPAGSGYHRGGDYDGYHGGGRWGGGIWYPGYGGGYYGNCDYGYCDGGYVGGTIACSPEVVQGNVAATDRVMSELIATPDFATAKTFKAEIAQVAKMKDSAERADAYMKLAGIDSAKKSAVADFVGSRNAKGAWITDLQRNSDLTSAQAEAVALKLQTALRGNLQ
jgi:hypothetical protein